VSGRWNWIEISRAHINDRARLNDIPTVEFDAAVAALWRKYHDAKAVLVVACWATALSVIS
jgi:hypothetical protein